MKPAELREKLAKGELIELLDIRERDEFMGGFKVPGSKNMPMGQVFVEAKAGRLPKDRKIVTICKTGGRGEIVARELRQKGYDIDHLEGGVDAWGGQ